MSYAIPETSASTDVDDFYNWSIAVPDMYREQARSLENPEEYDTGRTYKNRRTLHNSLLAESILRDKILPFVNGEASFDADTFEPSANPGGRYDKLQIQLSVPREMGDYIIDCAENADIVPNDYALRVYHNNFTEEFILRKIILGDEQEDD